MVPVDGSSATYCRKTPLKKKQTKKKCVTMLDGKTSAVVAGVCGAVVVMYCIYFDRKRRSDPLFKEKLRARKYFVASEALRARELAWLASMWSASYMDANQVALLVNVTIYCFRKTQSSGVQMFVVVVLLEIQLILIMCYLLPTCGGCQAS